MFKKESLGNLYDDVKTIKIELQNKKTFGIKIMSRFSRSVSVPFATTEIIIIDNNKIEHKMRIEYYFASANIQYYEENFRQEKIDYQNYNTNTILNKIINYISINEIINSKSKEEQIILQEKIKQSLVPIINDIENMISYRNDNLEEYIHNRKRLITEYEKEKNEKINEVLNTYNPIINKLEDELKEIDQNITSGKTK